jgi:DNA-binding beta-propeller fold protein YncE
LSARGAPNRANAAAAATPPVSVSPRVRTPAGCKSDCLRNNSCASRNFRVAFGACDGAGGKSRKATMAPLSSPLGLAVDSAGTVYFADRGNNRVRKIDAKTGFISTVAGSANIGFAGDNGPATQAALSGPNAVALDNSNNLLYICDFGNNCIRMVDLTTGIIKTVAGNRKYGFSGDGGPATQARLSFPHTIAVDTSGNLYITDNIDKIRKLSPNYLQHGQ